MSDRLIQFTVIGLYFAFILIKGLLHSRKIRHQDDFLVAGRNIGWFFLLCTMSATVLGGGASIGSIGKTYEWGILMLLVTFGWYLQFVFSGIFVAPKFRAMKLYTVAGFFGKRFDEKSRFLAFLLSLFFSVGVLGAQLVAFGKIINSIIPIIPYFWAVVIGSSIVILYSTAGGLMAVIHTDVIQFLVLIAGFALTAAFIIPNLLQYSTEVTMALPDNFMKIEGGKGWFFAIGTFLAFLLGETFAPGYATRFVVGKSVKDTKKGIVGAGIFLALVFPVLLFVIAVFAKLNFPDIDPEQALPKTIIRLNNPLIGGIIIAALMSAVMSSADSILNSATAIFIKDLYEHYLLKDKMPITKKGLRISRYFSVGLGLTGVMMALLLPNVIDLLLLTYTLWAPGIILPVVIGVFTKKRNAATNNLIFVTMTTAIIATLVFMNLKGPLFEQPSVLGVGTALVVYFSGWFFTRKAAPVLEYR